MQDKKMDDLNDQEQGGEEKVYELGYLLVPTIEETDVPATFGNLKELVITSGGVPISEEMPKRIALAYAMGKVIANVRRTFDSAYFGWIKFTASSHVVPELKKKLDLDPNLIRFLIIKTVKENTIASKRFIRPADGFKRPRPEKAGGTETAPINKEEIDKEIDAMVAAQ